MKTTCGLIIKVGFKIQLLLPVGGLFFIIEFPAEDIAEEAEEAVMVGGEGEEEN